MLASTRPGSRSKNSLVWIDGILHKICGHCGTPKPTADAFARSPKTSDGFQSWCKRCKADALAEMRQANPEKTVRQRRESYVRTRPAALERSRRSHARRSLDPTYGQANVARVRDWRRNNPQKRKLADMRRDARKAGLPDTMTAADVSFLYHYWHFACAICGKEEDLFGGQLVLDHWVALADPACPGTVATNMVLLCNGPGGCNTSKLATPALAWLTRRFGPRKAKAILRKVDAYFAAVREREQAGAVLIQ